MERLSGLDASFLYLETPTMQMHVAFVIICDTRSNPDGYRFSALAERIESRVNREPAFRRKLVQVPFNLNHPCGSKTVSFRFSIICGSTPCSRRAQMAQLGHLIGDIMEKPLDRRYPLWEAWVVEGLEEQRVAMVIKVHHAAVDGVSGTALLRHLFDEVAEVRERKWAPPAGGSGTR
ncbi:MAG: wax ester/triacylglycerol synthase family O-acyltransferase [Gammaproteobacteria bacterium]